MVPKADVGDEFLSGKMMLSSWNDMGVDGSYLFYRNISKYNCIISCNRSISCLLNVCFLFGIKLKYTYEYISFSRLSIQCCMISHIIYIYIYGCGSKCKVWIKPRSHKRSRPLIQTPDPDLSKGVDPDLWNDIIYGRVDVCSYSPCQAAKQQTVLKPRCQAVCTCCKATLLSSQAVKQPSWTCY